MGRSQWMDQSTFNITLLHGRRNRLPHWTVIRPSQITTRYSYVNNPNACKLMIANSAVIEVTDRDDYEIHLPEERLGYVSLSDIPPLYDGLTSCFWLNTVHSGFVIEHKNASGQNESTVLGFYCDKSTFRIHLYKIIR